MLSASSSHVNNTTNKYCACATLLSTQKNCSCFKTEVITQSDFTTVNFNVYTVVNGTSTDYYEYANLIRIA